MKVLLLITLLFQSAVVEPRVAMSAQIDNKELPAVKYDAGFGVIPAQYFGLHIHRASTTTPWPAVPFGSWRMWDARVAWINLEPQRGRWTFTALDSLLQLAQEHHVQVLLPLALSPQWASARPTESSIYGPGNGAEPRQLSDWDDYVKAVVSHCKGKVQGYEIWNEPNYKVFWTGQTSQLVDMARDAHAIINSLDPGVPLVSPSATDGPKGVDWLADFLARGGGKYVDVIGFHLYSETPESTAKLASQVRQTMKAYGVGALPLWNTECGWNKPKPFPSPELGAAYLARTYLLDWSAGVQRIFWYAWDNHGFSVIQTTESDDRTLSPAGHAYGMVMAWMVGAQLNACGMTNDHTWICTLRRGASTVHVIWNPDRNVNFVPPPSWRATSTTVLNQQKTAISTNVVKVTETPQLILSDASR